MSAPVPIPAPIIVSVIFAPTDQAWFEDLRRAHFPPERNHLAAHLTLFHHLPPSIAPELAQRLAAAARGQPPEARLTEIMNLGRGTALRIASPGLATLRSELAETFAALLTPQDQAGWRPHVTIQNKVDPAEAKRLREDLERDFTPRSIHIAALASWYYRSGPWEPIGRYRFRG